jgi:hypothetical protein
MQTTIDSKGAKGAYQSEITSIDFVEEVEPYQFELGVTLHDGTSQTFRMNLVTMRALMAQIALYSI